MILHPGIIGLLVGSVITVLMMLYAVITGLVIVARWDFSSSSAMQLGLERKTYLVSTLVNWGLAFQIASAFLFVYTLDDIHRLFVGAMCATGSLNANPVGWYALLSKIVVLFLSGFWLVLNSLDQSSERYPFVKLKYILLTALFPFLVTDLILQLVYFLGLDPAIITSCCGSLFGVGSTAAIASVSAAPLVPTMIVFWISGAVYLGLCWSVRLYPSVFLRYLLGIASVLYFVVSMVSIISFVSIYIYELPTHHCPFDILQNWYYFIGYPIYITLFLAVFFGADIGLFRPLKSRLGGEKIYVRFEKRWVGWCFVNTICFMLLVFFSVLFSNLEMLGG